MSIEKEIIQIFPKMKQWRQKIHSYPEIAYEEFKTSEFIEQKLKSFGITVYKNFGTTGLVGVLEGNKSSSKSIGLRADMDALPMSEKTNLKYQSKNEGKMHACGHDGHVTMLLGAAYALSKNQNFSGKVYFIFQPAEEGGRAGAKSMIDDGLFKKFKIDNVWGIHNWPGIPIGKAVIHKDFTMAGGDLFEIKIIGKGGHAAQPQNVSDPIIALGFILIAVQTIISRQLDPFSNAVISITKISAGSAFNVIPDEAYIGGTLRTTNNSERDTLLKKIKKMAEETASSHNCKIDFKINPGYPPTVNNEEKSLIASNVFKETFGKDMVLDNEKPTMTSEDFSYMLKERPGAYIWLGAGENSEKLHSPYFDFNDELLPIGAQFWKNLVHQVLN